MSTIQAGICSGSSGVTSTISAITGFDSRENFGTVKLTGQIAGTWVGNGVSEAVWMGRWPLLG